LTSRLIPGQALSHKSGGLARVTWATFFFILQICKNDIILVESFFKKSIGFNKI